MDGVTREINGIKDAISALAPDPDKVKTTSEQPDNILQLLSPILQMSTDVARISDTIQQWNSKRQGQGLHARNLLLLTFYRSRKTRNFSLVVASELLGEAIRRSI
jgi:hypothetical protein